MRSVRALVPHATVVLCVWITDSTAIAVSPAWQNTFGSSTRDFASGIATDGLGGIYITGQTDGIMFHQELQLHRANQACGEIIICVKLPYTFTG